LNGSLFFLLLTSIYWATNTVVQNGSRHGISRAWKRDSVIGLADKQNLTPVFSLVVSGKQQTAQEAGCRPDPRCRR
jgi:hypothetical protein